MSIYVVNWHRGQRSAGLHAFFETVNVALEKMAHLQDENKFRHVSHVKYPKRKMAASQGRHLKLIDFRVR